MRADTSPVTLNWGVNRSCTGLHAHWGDLEPCHLCGERTPVKDCQGRPSHKVCAERTLSVAQTADGD